MSSAAEISTVAIAGRVSRCDWTAIEDHLDAHGWAKLPKLLTRASAPTSRDFMTTTRGFEVMW